MLKMLQLGLNSTWTENFQMSKLDLEKAEQISNIYWIAEKAREFQKNIYFCFIDYTKALTLWITTNWKIVQWWEYQSTLPTSRETCM